MALAGVVPLPGGWAGSAGRHAPPPTHGTASTPAPPPDAGYVVEPASRAVGRLAAGVGRVAVRTPGDVVKMLLRP